jgi:hypothetical protein
MRGMTAEEARTPAIAMMSVVSIARTSAGWSSKDASNERDDSRINKDSSNNNAVSCQQ